MNTMKTSFGRITNRRGNALILAILTTMLLFVVGMVFLSSTLTEKASIENLGQEDILDNGVQLVVQKIHTELAKDIIDNSGKLLRGEPYDYPGQADPWLASLEPETYIDGAGDIRYYWPHITDLWGGFRFQSGNLQSVALGDGSSTSTFGGIDFSSYAGPMAVYYYDPDALDVDEIDPWDPATYSSEPLQWQANSVYDWQNPDSRPCWVSAYNTVAKIVHEDDPIQDCILDLNEDAYYRQPKWITKFGDRNKDPMVWSGSRADADGDGIADSRWVVIPDSKIADQDQWLWAAVRIVDNGGMINLNTALYFDPDTSDGSRLTDIDMEAICRSGDTAEKLHHYRCNLDDPIADVYYNDVARRVLYPDQSGTSGYSYTLFGLTDELEFRNRFFINTDVISTTESLWRIAYMGGGGVTKSEPYSHPDPLDPDTLENWYQKASYDLSTGLPDLYTRRHICTTYNFDRVISPEVQYSNESPDFYQKQYNQQMGSLRTTWNTWRDKGRPVCVNDIGTTFASGETLTCEIVAGAIWRALCPEGPEPIEDWIETDPNFRPLLHLPSFPGDPEWKTEQMRTRLACLMAVNLADYIDSDDPNLINTIENLDVYNKNGNQLCTETYYGFESQGERMYINRLGMAHYNDLVEEDDNDPNFYAISIYNPDNRPISTTAGWKLVCSNGTSTQEFDLPVITDIPKDDVIVLISESDATGYQAVGDTHEIGDEFNLTHFAENRIVLLDDKGVPLDAVKVPDIDFDDYLIGTGATTTRYITATGRALTGKSIGYGQHKILALDPEELSWTKEEEGSYSKIEDTDLNDSLFIKPVTAPIQLRCNDSGTMLNIGEIFNVLAIGGIKSVPSSGPEQYTSMSECWYRYINDLGGDIPVRNACAGRFDAADGVQVGKLTQFLTVFNPFSDQVDNDGNGLSDDPANDGEDNDHDGLIDLVNGDLDETFTKFGEKYELNVAGRININTSPWYVIAQLPWIQDPTLPANNQNELYQKTGLAHAIVAYRDKKSIVVPEETNPNNAAFTLNYSDRSQGISSGTPSQTVREEPGFMCINELLNVTHDLDGSMGAGSYNKYFDIRRYGRDSINNDDNQDDDSDSILNYEEGPFYDTKPDSAMDDIEERDILFKRISNLVTVRSDVFTAYILVRIGRDGPQKRVIAIFDRSNVFSASDKPKLIALHPVPDYK